MYYVYIYIYIYTCMHIHAFVKLTCTLTWVQLKMNPAACFHCSRHQNPALSIADYRVPRGELHLPALAAHGSEVCLLCVAICFRQHEGRHQEGEGLGPSKLRFGSAGGVQCARCLRCTLRAHFRSVAAQVCVYIYIYIYIHMNSYIDR